MRDGLLSKLRGYVGISIHEKQGTNAELLINRMLHDRMELWDIRRLPDGSVRLYLRLSDFFRLRALLKQTGCRVRVRERAGFPFFLNKLGNRKAFVAGIFLFMIGIYALSSLVWNVEISGNERLTDSEIRQAAREQGIYPLQWKFRLKDPDSMSSALERALEGTAWVGVEIKGTKISIRVVETTEPDAEELYSPRHIVAAHDAVVTQISAERGVPQVKVNTRVKKGQILISGILGDGENQDIVVAKGEVRGLVWYEYAIEVPLIQKHKVYTGETKTKRYLTLGDRALQLTGYGGPKFAKSDSMTERYGWSWRNFRFPIGWLNEEELELRYEERRIGAEEARQIGLQQARADLTARLGREAVVKEQKILHEKTDNGKVYMKALFEVEQDITGEAAIIPQSIPDHEQGD